LSLSIKPIPRSRKTPENNNIASKIPPIDSEEAKEL
jgi:hypothetical protein